MPRGPCARLYTKSRHKGGEITTVSVRVTGACTIYLARGGDVIKYRIYSICRYDYSTIPRESKVSLIRNRVSWSDRQRSESETPRSPPRAAGPPRRATEVRATVRLAADPASALALCACSLSTQRAAATVPLRTEVKLVACAQLSEAGS